MMKISKRRKEINKIIGDQMLFGLKEALLKLKAAPAAKFDESIEFSVRMGVDPRKSDQMIRGNVTLPFGTGKKITILVIAGGDKLKEATAAGADFVGGADMLEKIKGGWTDFDALIVTPDMMREVGKLGKILGPRGLMPSPKAGTVTNDIGNAIKDVKAGKMEFKLDKSGLINAAVGKVSFNENDLEENVLALLQAIRRAKPATAKGVYIQSLYLASTMGAGLRIDLQALSI